MNAYIKIANILQSAIAPVTTPPQTTSIQLAKEPRMIDNAPQRHLANEPRVSHNAPNATSATASNTSSIVSPNTQPAAGHTTDNMFGAAVEATSGASSKQHQTQTATLHTANSIVNQLKYQQILLFLRSFIPSILVAPFLSFLELLQFLFMSVRTDSSAAIFSSCADGPSHRSFDFRILNLCAAFCIS